MQNISNLCLNNIKTKTANTTRQKSDHILYISLSIYMKYRSWNSRKYRPKFFFFSFFFLLHVSWGVGTCIMQATKKHKQKLFYVFIVIGFG